MGTLHQRRKADRERQKRWRQKKLAEGQKQTLVMLGPEAQEILKREKERTGEPYVQIINRAIIGLKKKLPKAPKRIQKKQEPEAVGDPIPKMDRHSHIMRRPDDDGRPTLSGKGKWLPRN